MLILQTTSDALSLTTSTNGIHVVTYNHSITVGAGTSAVVSFNNNITAGNFYAVLVTWNNQTATHRVINSVTSSIVGDTVNTRTEFADLTGGTSAQLFYVEGSVGGACTITVNFSSTSANWAVQLVEISGLKTSSSFDVDIPGANGSSTTITSGTFSTANADEIALVVTGDMTNASQLFSASGGDTLLNAASGVVGAAGFYKIYTATQTNTTVAATYSISSSVPVIRGAVFKAASAIDVHASWTDYSGTTVTPGHTNTQITSATTTTVVPAPASSTQRGLKAFSARFVSTDYTGSGIVLTLKHTDGSTLVTLASTTLTANQVLEWDEESGFRVFDGAFNLIKDNIPGAGLLNYAVLLTSGSTYITGPRTNLIRIMMVGGGGGGGGCSSATSTGGAGGGGAAGSYLEKTIAVSPSTSYGFTIGSAGGGGATGANDGTAGGNTTITINGVTYTAPGGNPGKGCTAAATVLTLGGASAGVSTNGDLNSSGAPGQPGMVLASSAAISGGGGRSLFGAGAKGVSNTSGSAAIGFGAGGSGGAQQGNGGARAGGAGSAGAIYIEEYT